MILGPGPPTAGLIPRAREDCAKTRHLELIWRTGDRSSEYRFRGIERDKIGRWTSEGLQFGRS